MHQANHTYKSKDYTLEQTLIRSISYWSTRLVKSAKTLVWDPEVDSMVEVDHCFAPETKDLIQDVWVKILQPEVQAKLENIWNNPQLRKGGFLGVSKFISVVCTNTMLDGKKYLDVRAPEILGTNLDTPVTMSQGEDGVSEDTGTFQDMLSDWNGQRSPFFIDDLQGALTPEEFAVLTEAFVYGKTVREIAADTGTSKTSVGRALQSAKEKAECWVNELKTQSKEKTIANLRPVFYTRSNLWPDGISKENIEAWGQQLQTGPLHDPIREWGPPVHRTEFIPSKRHCINRACTNGLKVNAILDLVLPASSKETNIRFLPALTNLNNTLCVGCAKDSERFLQNQLACVPTVSETVGHLTDPRTLNDFHNQKESYVSA